MYCQGLRDSPSTGDSVRWFKRGLGAVAYGAAWGAAIGVSNHFEENRSWQRSLTGGIIVGIVIMGPSFYGIRTLAVRRRAKAGGQLPPPQ
jgi:hypothetical protein